MSDNRCERIAELLLIEREIKKIEQVSSCFYFSEVCAVFDYYIAQDKPLTPIEKVMLAILLKIQDKCGICVEPQMKIGKYRVDFLVTFLRDKKRKIIIECDGHDFHEKTKEQAKHDKERDRYFTAEGYEIYHYTGSEIYNDFDEIEDQLENIIIFGGEK